MTRKSWVANSPDMFVCCPFVAEEAIRLATELDCAYQEQSGSEMDMIGPNWGGFGPRCAYLCVLVSGGLEQDKEWHR